MGPFFIQSSLFSEPQTIGQSEQMKKLYSIKYEVAPVQGGYTDKILQLDLTSLTISTIDVEPDYRRKYVGGRGYAIKPYPVQSPTLYDWTPDRRQRMA